MNLPKQKIQETSAKYAQKLIREAIRNEPAITKDLQKIASEVSAEMVGLENKFKANDSLSEKITQKTQKNIKIFRESDYSFEEAFEKALKIQVKNINDVLRYTFILPFDSYVFTFKKSLENLKRNGYKILENKIWNAWKRAGTKYDKGYHGINITIISSQNQVFEIQFPTRKSFQLKMENHNLYKKAVSAKSSVEASKRAIQKMVESAKNILIPEGVKNL